MILESDTPAVTQFSVGDLKAGDKFRVLFPVFNRAEGVRVSVRKKDGSLEELKLNQDYAVLIPPNSGQAGYTAEVEYIGEERSDVYVFIVERVIRLSQETNLSSYGAEGRNQEFSLDKLTCILQDTRTGLRISSSEVNNPLTGTPKLELPYNRENSILAFDENRNVRVIPEYTGGENTEITDENVINVHIDTATPEGDGLMSKEDKAKLDGVEDEAQKNIQSDWNEIDNNSDAYIKNKPNLSKVALSNNYNDLDNKPALKPVATSGIYKDLDNRPTAVDGIELTEETYPKLRLKHASAETLGGIKIGMNLTIEDDGTMHAESGIQDLVAGDNIIIDNVGDIQDGIQGAFHSVIYGHGLYVAIGYGVIARSPDGRNWIKNNIVDWFPTLTDATLTSIISDDTRFVVSVRSPACFLEISKDFSSHNMIPFSDDIRIDGIVSLKDNGMYGVYGDTASTGVGFVRCTVDFLNWSGPVGIFENWFRADHACYVATYTETTSLRYIFFTGGTSTVVRGTVGGNYIFDLVAYQVLEGGFLTGITNTEMGLLVTSSSGIIYISTDFGETWEFWSQPSTNMTDVFDYNDTEYYAAAGGSLFYSEDGKHWKDSYLGEQYVFSGLYVTNNLIVAAGAKAMGGDGRHLYYIPLGDLTISAIDTTYVTATRWDDGLMSREDKKKLEDLAEVAISGSYNDLSNKLVGGENIRIDENNVVSYVGGAGADLYKAGEHIKIEKEHNVEQCYKGSNSTVDILLCNDEHVTAPIYPNKLMLSDVSRKCEEWQEVVLPFEYSGYGVVRSNSHIYVVDKDNHARKSSIDNLVTWLDDGKIPKEPWSYAFYTGAYGICEGKEHVVFYAIVNPDPSETAIAYYIDGVPRPLKTVPYNIVGMAFGGNKIYCVTDAVNILVYNYEFTNLLQTLTIPLTSLIDIKYSNNRLLVLAWEGNTKKCLYAASYPYDSFEKVSDDFDKDSLRKIFVYKNTFSFVCDNKLYTSEDAFNWSYTILDKTYEFGIYLNKFSLVYEKSNHALFKHMGGMNTISATYENATAEADGLMSKEDKVKLNSVMKFPDGEAGYTLPNATGRADKTITFDSDGNIDLHATWAYDNWRNVKVPTAESTFGLNLELPNPAGRANKVIGFNANGKSVEMKDASGADITVGEGLQRQGNEISMKLATAYTLGGITVSEDANVPLVLDEYGKLTLQVATGFDIARGEYGDKTLHLRKATELFLGGVKVGSGLNINSDGVLSATGGGVLNPATTTVLGGIKVGENLGISADGTLRAYLPGDLYLDRIASVMLPSIGYWESVCYGGDKFVAVARGSEHGACSSDGINWTQTTFPYEANWISVCYGGGKYVAIGDNCCAVSSDGIKWGASTIPSHGGRFGSVCYGGGKFMTVEKFNSNKASCSIDGITWTESTLPYVGYWKSVCYGNDKFVTVAESTGNIAAYSYDGITWDESALPSYGDWAVCYGGGKFVAVAYGVESGAYSYDGINWYEMNMPSAAGWQSVCYGGGKFIAVSDNNSNTGAYSHDGITWKAIILPSYGEWQSICYGGDKFVAVSNDNSNNGTIIPCVPIIKD